MSYTEQHLKVQSQSNYPHQLVWYLAERFNLFGKMVADFGCGRGGYTCEWHKVAEVIGVDYETQPSLPVPVLQADLSKPFLWTDSCDRVEVVFSKSVLEHIQSPQTYLQNIWDALEDHGLLILLTPDWKTTWKVFYDDYTHVHPYSAISLREAVPSCWGDVQVQLFWQIAWSWKWPHLFRWLRWTRFFMRQGDVRRRMSHAALLLTCRKQWNSHDLT